MEINRGNGRIVFCQKFLSALFRLPKIVQVILGFNYFYFCSIIYCCQEDYLNDLCRQLGFLAKAKCFLGNFLFFQIFHWSNLLLCSYVSTTPIGQIGLKMGKFPLGNGTVCWIEVKVAVLCAHQYMPWNLLLIKVLDNFWHFKHQIPTRTCSEAYL